jgi:hypothetical protein
VTKWKIIRITEENYKRAVEGFEYGETFNSIFSKILDERDKKRKK